MIKTYRREDGLLMVEIEPDKAVNVVSARRLALVGADMKLPADRKTSQEGRD